MEAGASRCAWEAHVTTQGKQEQRACRLCGLYLGRSQTPAAASRAVCEVCSERREAESSAGLAEACPRCERHRDLCAVSPCSEADLPLPAALVAAGEAGQPNGRISAPSGGAEAAQE